MKKYDILVVNGCSFTHGPYDTEQKRENAFSVNMAKELGCVHSNLSKPGGSNDRIIRTTYDFIEKRIDKKSKNLFIFGLSGLGRMDVFTNYSLKNTQGEYCQFNFNEFKISQNRGFTRKFNLQELGISEKTEIEFAKFYLKYFMEENNSLQHYFRQLQMLVSHIKYKNPNNDVIIFSSLLKGIHENIKKQFNWFEFEVGETWMEFINTKREFKTSGHPNIKGHQFMCEEMLSYVKNEL
tara:strand:+ start:228 stop:941 length:714 start_codon:yes stop_codon:yes gene_type:complete